MIASQEEPELIEGQKYRVYFQIPSDRTSSGIANGDFVDVYRGEKVLNGHKFLCWTDAPPLDVRFFVDARPAR